MHLLIRTFHELASIVRPGAEVADEAIPFFTRKLIWSKLLFELCRQVPETDLLATKFVLEKIQSHKTNSCMRAPIKSQRAPLTQVHAFFAAKLVSMHVNMLEDMEVRLLIIWWIRRRKHEDLHAVWHRRFGSES